MKLFELIPPVLTLISRAFYELILELQLISQDTLGKVHYFFIQFERQIIST